MLELQNREDINYTSSKQYKQLKVIQMEKYEVVKMKKEKLTKHLMFLFFNKMNIHLNGHNNQMDHKKGWA